MGPRENAARGWTPVVWGFAGQAFSSATNLALSVLAGRALGPSGLGRVFLGFTAYLVVLGLHRALLVEPLIASTSARDPMDKHVSAMRALTVSASFAIISSAIIGCAGLWLGGATGRGLLLVVPWLLPCLVQDLWRWILFRDDRPAAGALNDGTWLITMAIVVPITWAIRSDWAVISAWGVGAFAGAVLGFLQLSVRPSHPWSAWRWWRAQAWPFGRWVAGAVVLSNVLGNATVFVVSALIGAAALGGLRAAEAVFAPLTLVIPALALPGLPALARAPEPHLQRRLAWRYSGLALVAVIGYASVMLLGGTRILPLVFGSEFRGFSHLLGPIGAAQLFTAAGLGVSLMLRARQRGAALLVSRVIGGGLALALTAAVARPLGIAAVAWAAAAGACVTTLVQWATANSSEQRARFAADGMDATLPERSEPVPP